MNNDEYDFVYFKILKEVNINGYYCEPLYDDIPSFDFYTNEFSKTYHKEDVISGFINNKNELELLDSNYGVSEWGSKAYLKFNIQAFINQGILKKMSNNEINNYFELEEKRENYFSICEKLGEFESFFSEAENVKDFTEDDYMYLLLDWIHAKADFSIAKIKYCD